ncbi:alpha/beta fold hydrolase [Bacillus sp. 31A1R]|uniref:Alpha/beta fold hydrolase n=1 Tax=Robertmurraya mangrovi TaxID=3098077 RepID=A0ABU5J384_9BACI|nr:alpha/beta fold hydrolase [Bacillus sp. 31A1R]MDZ5473880.1 alpha/beta fold hydrolase [Bacillus sp. 31A1R]
MITFKQASMESYFRTLNITDFDVSPQQDEIIYSTNLNGHYNLWAMKLDKGYPYQMTNTNQMNSFVKYDPSGRYILTGYDFDGDEDYHVYAFPPTGGETTPILQKKGEKYYYGELSKDGNTFYYVTSEGNPSFLNICRINLETNEKEVLLSGDVGPSYLYSVSPDESSFAYSKSIGNTSAFGYIARNQEHILISPAGEEAHRVSQVEYLTNDEVLVLSNFGSEFTYLASFHLQTKTFEKLVELDGFELSQLTLDSTNNRVFFVAGRGAEDHLYVYELETKKLDRVDKPFDIVDKIVIKNGHLYTLGRSSVTPANLYRSEQLNDWEQLTEHQLLGVKESELIQPEVLSYSSFDGLEIEALYFSPKKELDNGYTILWPHGGPQWAERKNFRAIFQYLCSQGYRIFTPNFRGSTGYGESFLKLVNKDWGGGPRLDIIAGMDWLIEQGKASTDKWFCIGGSYGGYMTLLLHGRHSDRFKAFVDIFGPSNLFTTLETAPEHWKAADAESIGDAVIDREKLIEDSPMTYIDAMNKPMLVIQGANDPRVVKVESDVIVEAMQSRGQDVEYLVLEDEGHGFSKTENAIKVYKTMVSFLQKYVD